jgi:uncharacterized membrane protein (DUF485 family)
MTFALIVAVFAFTFLYIYFLFAKVEIERMRESIEEIKQKLGGQNV